MTVVLITGIQAAGTSTVAQLLAERLPRSVHVRGDVFRRMVVKGRADMTPTPSDEAVRQLRLRYRLAAATADTYAGAGFTVVLQDIVLGSDLPGMVELIRARPVHVVVLAPAPAVAALRDGQRHKRAYGSSWTADQLDAELRATPRLGLWIDNSAQTPAETVDAILSYAGFRLGA
jgi:hypothetical protein